MELVKVPSSDHHYDWALEEDGRRLALIVMDPWDQMEKVVVFEPKANRRVLEIAEHHCRNFVKHRDDSVFGGLIVAQRNNPHLTEADSERVLREALYYIDRDIKAMTDEALMACFRHGRDSRVIYAVAPHLGAALTRICAALEAKHGIKVRYKIGRPTYYDEMPVVFSVKGDQNFTFWKSIRWSDRWENLHILPAYHPERSGQHDAYLLNGDTSAIIRGRAFGSAAPPEGSMVDIRPWYGSWQVKHPFYARGKSVLITAHPFEILDEAGLADAEHFLTCALGLTDKYVAISGGFNPPLDYPSNICNRGRIRGCEHMCVWEYRTLQAEGKLDDALIPEWFQREGWLDIYKGYKEKWK